MVSESWENEKQKRNVPGFWRGNTLAQSCNNPPHKTSKSFLNMFARDPLVAVVALGVSCTLVLAIWLFVLLIGHLVDRMVDLCLNWFDPEVKLPPVEPRHFFWLAHDAIEADDVKEDGGSKRRPENARVLCVEED